MKPSRLAELLQLPYFPCKVLLQQYRQELEIRLAEIDELLEVWDPPANLKDGKRTYAYKLKPSYMVRCVFHTLVVVRSLTI